MKQKHETLKFEQENDMKYTKYQVFLKQKNVKFEQEIENGKFK